MIASPDQHLDRVLDALRDTPPPTGLAARVNARLLQAPEESPVNAVILSFAKDPRILLGSPMRIGWAATACVAIALALLATLHQPAPTIAEISSETPATQTHPSLPVPATTRVVQGFSLLSHSDSMATERDSARVPDLDAIALAETLAPSHTAPPLPLTAQEALLLRSTRQGQPIEVAELEIRRTSALTQIAEAREQATVRQYIHGLLGPLATAQTLTPPPSPSDDTKPAADSEIPPSQ
jgi:hypothetical protein